MRAKSNDAIPEDEMLLAKMLQNAGARGWDACQNSFFRDRNFTSSRSTTTTTSCCAAGAMMLEPDTLAIHNTGTYSGVVYGNDSTGSYWSSFTDLGEDLGYAFQQALNPRASWK